MHIHTHTHTHYTYMFSFVRNLVTDLLSDKQKFYIQNTLTHMHINVFFCQKPGY